MEHKITHIRNLVHLGKADHDFHDNEKKYIHQVGLRLGLSPEQIEFEMTAETSVTPIPPKEEILRFMLLDDLINLMAADEKIRDEEIQVCKKAASLLGFDPEVISGIADKLKSHFDEGFSGNQLQFLIKNELYKATLKNLYHEKYG